MEIKKKIIINLALVTLMIFLGSSSVSATESAWQNLNPSFESGLSGTVTNCSPLTVTNGTVAAYPTCTITCNSGYSLSGSSCNASGGGGSSGGSASDTTPPTNTSVSVSAGAASTTSVSVSLTLAATGASQMMISNSVSFTGAVWETYAVNKAWTLVSGNGVKTVYAKFKDSAGNVSVAVSDTITLGSAGTTTTTVPTTTTPATTTPSAYNFGTTVLKNGSQGEAVKELQKFLNATLNLGLAVDGALGPKTIAVIKQWQANNGLVADGLIGPATKAKMNASVQ